LRSKTQADQFYQVLEKSRSVYELKVGLLWDTTQNDLKKLQDTLSKTSVGVLELDLGITDGPTSDIVNRSHRYDPVLDIMRHPSIRSFAIRGPENLSKRSSLLSRHDDLSNLRHLDISLSDLRDDIPGTRHLISKASSLSSLAVRTGSYSCHALNAYGTIAKHWSYSIHFKDWDRTIPPPSRGSDQAVATEQCMEHLLKVHREKSSSELNVDVLDESTMNSIANATTRGSTFTALNLSRLKGRLGDSFVNDISSVVGRSKLNEVTIHTWKDEGRVRILESIQWQHLRRLYIDMKPGTFETSVMRALVDGVKKMSEKVELDEFVFWSEDAIRGSFHGLTLPQEDLLQAFFASTSIETLKLNLDVTLKQTLSLFMAADFSRLKLLRMWTSRFDSVKVDAILDSLQHATKLNRLQIIGATITEEQKSRMEAKGVELGRD
jgi:hypothetical protein